MLPLRPASIAQTTPTGAAVAQQVMHDYAFGDVTVCELLRIGFNHVYGLRFSDGQRAVARLSAERSRGAPNTAYEAALLAHLQAHGAAVAAPLMARDGAATTTMQLPEGPRTLMLFQHLHGEPPGQALPDIEATGRGVALLHQAAQHYAGPASRYRLDLPYLLDAPLQRLCAASTMDDDLRTQFSAIAQRAATRTTALPPLTRVACHGDCHGGNNVMTDGPDGARVASFFDFDDAGPGWLAYELCVYLSALLPRKADSPLDAGALERWGRYLAGYRSVRPIAPADFDAIATFVVVRQLWLLGEYASRLAVWGTQALPTKWLREHAGLLTAWESLTTPQ